ncbi:hypothetical protein GW17_00053523 [Ensete ventricosum]|nr:hypothetical protein GW17_00053523 [Ensete ventricosum]
MGLSFVPRFSGDLEAPLLGTWQQAFCHGSNNKRSIDPYGHPSSCRKISCRVCHRSPSPAECPCCAPLSPARRLRPLRRRSLLIAASAGPPLPHARPPSPTPTTECRRVRRADLIGAHPLCCMKPPPRAPRTSDSLLPDSWRR